MLTSRQKDLLAFQTQLLAVAAERTDLHRGVRPRPFYAAGRVRNHLELNYCILANHARVELEVNNPRGRHGWSRAVLDHLVGHRDEIERGFGGPLRFEASSQSEACRVYTVLDCGGIDSPASWPVLQAAMVDAMIRLEAAIRPYCSDLPA